MVELITNLTDSGEHSSSVSEVELHESDVLWSFFPIPNNLPSSHFTRRLPNRFNSPSGLSALLHDGHRRQSKVIPESPTTEKVPVKFHQSAPVNIAAWPPNNFHDGLDKINEDCNCDFKTLLDEEEEEEEEKKIIMVPPHVIVARSHVAFSVFEGVGRTLKGRDLRRVRNAVFRKTGFID